MAKIHTLDLKKRVCSACQQIEKVAEVDFASDGYIQEIRVWSEYFSAYVSVSEAWLENNYPNRLQSIRSKIADHLGEMEMSKKEFNNDDAEIA